MATRKRTAKKTKPVQVEILPEQGIILGGARARVWFGCGIKVQVRQYEPTDVSCGMSRDVMIGETPEEALQACKDLVLPEIVTQQHELRALSMGEHPSQKGKGKGR